MTEMLCKDCNQVVQFVQPECEDGHEDCPDLMCVLCGAAITLGGRQAAGRGRDERHSSAA